jgi:SAM-dependent methyltransferase
MLSVLSAATIAALFALVNITEIVITAKAPARPSPACNAASRSLAGVRTRDPPDGRQPGRKGGYPVSAEPGDLYAAMRMADGRPAPGTADERAGAARHSLAPSYACPALMPPGGQSMTNYARMYRFGITPWERYRTAAAASIAALLDREETERSRPLGRALDLGCGRGQYTPELARRGWEAVGIDYVPAAIEAAAAKSRGADGLSYVAGDVTRLPSARLGTFDFFLDIGCFQGLDAGQRLAQGEGVYTLANPGATLLLLSFGPSRWRPLVDGASQEEVQTAFAGWQMLAAEPADTAGLGWPMNKTAPRWYRLRRRT